MPDQDKPGGPALAEEHRAIIHSEDATRPVTAAVSSLDAGYSGFQNHFDVFGWNYHPTNYAQFRATNANIPMFGSETASTVSSRGEYFFPPGAFPPPKEYKPALVDFQVSSYDNYAPHWATLPDTEFRAQEENPFIAGEFVWTGFDYLGEPTPYSKDATNMLNFSELARTELAKQELAATGKIKTPSRSSYFGIVDLAGFKKDRFYLYQAHWRPDFPMAHILPHWTWPERTGMVTPVYVYTSGDSAELFLNGKSLGRRSFDSAEFFLNGKSLGVEKTGERDYRLRWDDVVYEPGTLKVVAYKHGKKWATDEVQTAGDPAKLRLAADRSRIAADGRDLSFITVSVRDKNGILAPRAGNHVKFSIQGPGEIVATDNGDPTSFESFQAPERHAFNGLALVIVRGKIGGKGEIVLKAESPGLKSAEIKLKSF